MDSRRGEALLESPIRLVPIFGRRSPAFAVLNFRIGHVAISSSRTSQGTEPSTTRRSKGRPGTNSEAVGSTCPPSSEPHTPEPGSTRVSAPRCRAEPRHSRPRFGHSPSRRLAQPTRQRFQAVEPPWDQGPSSPGEPVPSPVQAPPSPAHLTAESMGQASASVLEEVDHGFLIGSRRLGRRRGRRRPHVGHQIRDGDVDFVPHAGHDRNGTRRDGPGNRLFIEAPEVLDRAPPRATITSTPPLSPQDPERLGNLSPAPSPWTRVPRITMWSHGALLLVTDMMSRRAAPVGDVTTPMRLGNRGRGALPGRVHEAFRRQLLPRPLEGQLPEALHVGQLEAAHHHLEGAPGFVQGEAAEHFDRRTLLGKGPEAGPLPAET